MWTNKYLFTCSLIYLLEIGMTIWAIYDFHATCFVIGQLQMLLILHSSHAIITFQI